MKKKKGAGRKKPSPVWKLLTVALQTLNLALALLLAVYRRREIAAAIDANGLRGREDELEIIGGEDGPTALRVK